LALGPHAKKTRAPDNFDVADVQARACLTYQFSIHELAEATGMAILLMIAYLLIKNPAGGPVSKIGLLVRY